MQALLHQQFCLTFTRYIFQVVHSILLFDILKKLTEGFQEKDIELLLLLLKSKLSDMSCKYMCIDQEVINIFLHKI